LGGHSKDVHVTVVVTADGSVRVDRTPFQAEQAIGITPRSLETVPGTPSASRYPLAGLPVEYLEPFEGVAGDWEASR